MMVGLWVLVVTDVCGVVRAGCVCAARLCCFVSLTCTSAPKWCFSVSSFDCVPCLAYGAGLQ
jgi:hypothetical protein